MCVDFLFSLAFKCVCVVFKCADVWFVLYRCVYVLKHMCVFCFCLPMCVSACVTCMHHSNSGSSQHGCLWMKYCGLIVDCHCDVDYVLTVLIGEIIMMMVLKMVTGSCWWWLILMLISDWLLSLQEPTRWNGDTYPCALPRLEWYVIIVRLARSDAVHHSSWQCDSARPCITWHEWWHPRPDIAGTVLIFLLKKQTKLFDITVSPSMSYNYPFFSPVFPPPFLFPLCSLSLFPVFPLCQRMTSTTTWLLLWLEAWMPVWVRKTRMSSSTFRSLSTTM